VRGAGGKEATGACARGPVESGGSGGGGGAWGGGGGGGGGLAPGVGAPRAGLPAGLGSRPAEEGQCHCRIARSSAPGEGRWGDRVVGDSGEEQVWGRKRETAEKVQMKKPLLNSFGSISLLGVRAECPIGDTALETPLVISDFSLA
jgi:hypothetical protein